MIASPCGVWRSRMAWAMAIPTQITPSAVIAIASLSVGLALAPGQGQSEQEDQRHERHEGQQHLALSPGLRGHGEAAQGEEAGQAHRAHRPYMRNSSCRQTRPSSRMPPAKIQPPATMMKIA